MRVTLLESLLAVFMAFTQPICLPDIQLYVSKRHQLVDFRRWGLLLETAKSLHRVRDGHLGPLRVFGLFRQRLQWFVAGWLWARPSWSRWDSPDLLAVVARRANHEPFVWPPHFR